MLVITVVNDETGTEKRGNYNYVVCIGPEVIAKGRIENHTKEMGWRNLAQRILDQEEPNAATREQTAQIQTDK